MKVAYVQVSYTKRRPNTEGPARKDIGAALLTVRWQACEKQSSSQMAARDTEFLYDQSEDGKESPG